jgi:hypothetical protein
MFFRSDTTLEEKAWREEWARARTDSHIKWYTLPCEKEHRKLYKIFEEKIEEIFEGISIYQIFYYDELPEENIHETLKLYKEALLDELWNDSSYASVKHVMEAARALEKVNQCAILGYRSTPQVKQFIENAANFKKKAQHSGFSPFTKMCGGVLASYWVGVGIFLTTLFLSALIPPVMGVVASLGLILPIALGCRLSYLKFNPAMVAGDIGEEISDKLNSVKFAAK